MNRRKDGTFGPWKGGRDLKDLKKKENNFHGIATHIGIQFRKQHGRRARTGDLVRTRTKDGSYHKGASWYIKTPHGWRKSPTGTRKPTRSQVRKIMKRSRKGERHY